MGPVSAAVDVDAPRERVFDLIGDLASRPAFTDHFISDFHLTRIASSGAGAGARFRLALPPRALWMDTAISVCEAPRRIVERGCGGPSNRIPAVTVWELLEGPGSLTSVRLSFWTEPSDRVDRALDLLGGTSLWHARAWRRALRRLRDLVESSESAPVRHAIIAGGNPHATGIP
jgi:hypothetical protein